jgi:two-component system chemotaxis response regulator CheB
MSASGGGGAPAGIEAVAVGVSAGALEALRVLLRPLPADFHPAMLIVTHNSSDGPHLLPGLLARECRLPVLEAEEREPVRPGHVYIAPPNYHLLVERERTFSLSVDERVCNVRPSVDVLFQSAADAYRRQLVGVVLTGANGDGARGLKAIRDAGGRTLAQDPETAYAPTMPLRAIEAGAVERVLPLDRLAVDLLALCASNGEAP